VEPVCRILTLNLRHYWADDGEHAWDRRKSAVAGLLQAHRAEVVCFQEVNRPILGFLSARLPGYKLVSDPVDRGQRWEYRPLFLSPSCRLLEMETLSLSENPHRPSKFEGSDYIRQATRAAIRLGGRTLTVYNTHLDFEEQTQVRQAAVIWQSVRDRDPGRPVILVGDFNSTPDQAAYLFLTGQREFEGRRGDFLDAAPDPKPNTFHGFTGRARPGYIDWILFRGPGLEVEEPARVIEGRFAGLFPSDHFPVEAAFRLTGGGGRS